MALENLDLEEIKKLFAEVWQSGGRRDLKKQRDVARQLKSEVKRIKPRGANAIAIVAADGGDNRIRLGAAGDDDSAVMELVRVVDSRGKTHAMQPFPGRLEDSDFNNARIGAVEKLCQDLGARRVSDLWKKTENRKMRMYRDTVEWAVVYDLLTTEWPMDTLLVREGTLHAWAFQPIFFEKMDRKIRTACQRHRDKHNVDIFFAGVAKSNRLLSRLEFALLLEGVFERDYPCYLRVPREIAIKHYGRRWVDTSETAFGDKYESMGNLFLVKFGDHPLSSVWPVSIAAEQTDDAGQILSHLAEDARIGFPIPEFPMCIQKAHEHAKISGMEISYLEDMFFDIIMEGANADEREKFLRDRHLREDLAALRYHRE